MPIDYKWKFAIGHTSRVPNMGGMHYLIGDFDQDEIPKETIKFLTHFASHIVFQKTEHGWHMYSDMKVSHEQFYHYATGMHADDTWIKIGKERGYWFLADKSQLILTWPVEYMVLHYEEKT